MYIYMYIKEENSGILQLRNIELCGHRGKQLVLTRLKIYAAARKCFLPGFSRVPLYDDVDDNGLSARIESQY